MAIKALVFDAYGTLFDVHTVAELCERTFPGKGMALSQLWRAKQLEYTWLRSLMGRYEDFARITADALRHACSALELKLEAAHLLRLMDAYDRLALFADAREALPALSGYKRAILSNGTPAMLDALVKHAGLERQLDALLSVDAARVFKPDPRVYQLAVDRLALPPPEIGFVSSNYWDAAGAKSFGFRVFWINRGGVTPDALGITPDAAMKSLAELPQHPA
ncbi:MAG: haloacid dehalogenase type II [Betaproteobacteria bacterium]|nr:haloacid dehalogenase type II [Betaproteobacteria bacterium]